MRLWSDAGQRSRRVLTMLWLSLQVTMGCGEADAPSGAAVESVAREPEEPALAATTSPRTRVPIVEGIGDAENATFSPDGRLFVTGGANAYEIVKRDERYEALPLYAGTCNFTGIATHGGYLYTTCLEGTFGQPSARALLLVSPLSERVELKVLYRFTKVMFPNGIAFDARGRLFVADFTPLMGQIVALSLDATSPPRVASETVWHGMGTLVNGLKVFREKVYFTDAGQIKVIPIGAGGGAGRPTVLATRLAVFDDLWVSDAGIVVADFYGRVLVSYSLTGQMLGQTAPLFDTPSSITPGRAPLVPEGALVITEKGALGELTSSDGNRVSLYFP